MRTIHLPFIAPVAGVSFRQAVLREVVEGDHLTVTANPDNPHDADACEVTTGGGELVGFIPAALAGRLAQRGDGPWPALVREVLRNETWGLRIEVLEAGADLPEGPRGPSAVADATERAEAGELAGAAGTGRAVPSVSGEEARMVKARSGRTLGPLIRVTDTHVVVDRDGVEMNFPAELVTVSAAEPR